jgi:hypothetical protein
VGLFFIATPQFLLGLEQRRLGLTNQDVGFVDQLVALLHQMPCGFPNRLSSLPHGHGKQRAAVDVGPDVLGEVPSTSRAHVGPAAERMGEPAVCRLDDVSDRDPPRILRAAHLHQ